MDGARSPVVLLPATSVEGAADIDQIVEGLANSVVSWAAESQTPTAEASLALSINLLTGSWTRAPTTRPLAAEIELRLAGGGSGAV
jgi:hypothetical protein